MLRRQILVLEDEGDSADLSPSSMALQAALQRSGFAPAFASSREEAVEKAGTLKPDLVLVDSVENESGDQVQAVSEIRSHLDVPVVFVMPYGDETALEKAVARAKSSEPEGFLLKPYQEKELVRTVETVLREYDLARKRTHAHQQLLALAETTPDFVATTDVEGNILYLNPAARTMLGLDYGEDLPHIADAHPTWANAIVLGAGIQTALLDGVWRGEASLLTREGQEIPVSEAIVAHTGTDGRCEFLSIVARDISEIKRTENALRQSEQFYRRIVETANTGIWQIDPENRVKFANPAMARLLGYTVEEMLGQPLSRFLNFKDHAANDAEPDVPQHGIKDQRKFMLRRKDGDEFWATLSTSPLYDSEEKYTGVMGMVVEVGG